MVWRQPEALRLLRPGFADGLERREAGEGLQPLGVASPDVV